MPTSTAILNVQLIFDSCFACMCFGSSSILSIPKYESKNLYQIKCPKAFRMWTVAYDEATLDRSNVYRWYKLFAEGREDVNNKERAGDTRVRQKQTKALMK